MLWSGKSRTGSGDARRRERIVSRSSWLLQRSATKNSSAPCSLAAAMAPSRLAKISLEGQPRFVVTGTRKTSCLPKHCNKKLALNPINSAGSRIVTTRRPSMFPADRMAHVARAKIQRAITKSISWSNKVAIKGQKDKATLPFSENTDPVATKAVMANIVKSWLKNGSSTGRR